MKRIILPFLILLLLTACQWKNEDINFPQYRISQSYPQWVTDTLCVFDDDQDEHPDTVWQYFYIGNWVYYFPAFETGGTYVHDELYSRWGNFMGYPDGGPDGDGDSLIENFHDRKGYPLMVWHDGIWPNTTKEYDYEIINAVLEHQYGDSSFIHLLDRSESRFWADSTRKHLQINGVQYDPLLLTAGYFKNYLDVFWDPDVFLGSVVIKSTGGTDYLNDYQEEYPESFGLIRFGVPALSPFEDMAIVEYVLYDLDFTGKTRYYCILHPTEGTWTLRNIFETHGY